jgi:hypothetical protein
MPPSDSAPSSSGHGAGGRPGMPPDLQLLAHRLPNRGTTVVRFEQPWRTAGRRAAVPPAQLDEAWLAAIELERQPWATGRLFVGGRSAGPGCLPHRRPDRSRRCRLSWRSPASSGPAGPFQTCRSCSPPPWTGWCAARGCLWCGPSRLALDGAPGITVIDLPASMATGCPKRGLWQETCGRRSAVESVVGDSSLH